MFGYGKLAPLEAEIARLRAELAAYKEQNDRLLERLIGRPLSSQPIGGGVAGVPAFKAPLSQQEPIDLFADVEEPEDADNRKLKFDTFQG